MHRQDKKIVAAVFGVLIIGIAWMLTRFNSVPLVTLNQLKTENVTLNKKQVKIRGYYWGGGGEGELRNYSNKKAIALVPAEQDKYIRSAGGYDIVQLLPAINGTVLDDFIEVEGTLEAEKSILHVTNWRKIESPKH